MCNSHEATSRSGKESAAFVWKAAESALMGWQDSSKAVSFSISIGVYILRWRTTKEEDWIWASERGLDWDIYILFVILTIIYSESEKVTESEL